MSHNPKVTGHNLKVMGHNPRVTGTGRIIFHIGIYPSRMTPLCTRRIPITITSIINKIINIPFIPDAIQIWYCWWYCWNKDWWCWSTADAVVIMCYIHDASEWHSHVMRWDRCHDSHLFQSKSVTSTQSDVNRCWADVAQSDNQWSQTR